MSPRLQVRGMSDVLGVAIVGCGNIAQRYADTLRHQPALRLTGAFDVDAERARALAAHVAGRAYASLDELLDDDAVDLVVDLAIHHVHPEVNRRCLAAGKHVHSEKPLALTAAEAHAQADLAEQRGLRLSCAPITWLGEAQQTAWKALRDGRVGPVRLVYAEANHGRIETWHPQPAPFYDVGVLFDVAVYPLSIATAFLGPVRRVQAAGRVLLAERTDLAGAPFAVETPDLVIAVLELEGGAVVRLTANFYVDSAASRVGMDFHGDRASLHLGSWQRMDAAVEVAPFGQPYEPLPLVREAYAGTDWARGVVDVAEALRDGRPHRAGARHAAHVIEVIEAVHASLAGDGAAVQVESRFAPPAPMPWAADG
jgi:predicted dehydrogenase